MADPQPDGTLFVYSQGQGIWEDRRQIASFLGEPEEKVRVILVSSGEAFGAEEDLTRRPTRRCRPGHRAPGARHVEPRREHPLPPEAPPDGDAVHHGVRRGRADRRGSGAPRGRHGAYASVGAKVLERAAGHACGPYKVPNVDVEARAVYTNNPPCGAMRGLSPTRRTSPLRGCSTAWRSAWGSTAGNPLANAVDVGDRFGTGQKLGPGVGLKKTLLAVRDAYRGARFAGIACAAKNSGVGNGMTEYGKAILRPG